MHENVPKVCRNHIVSTTCLLNQRYFCLVKSPGLHDRLYLDTSEGQHVDQ